jgi:hypothetical protein
MKPIGQFAPEMCILLVLGATLCPANAETKLTDFNGVWHGTGQDRNSPLESMQRTRCQTTVNADPIRMTATTNCNGEAGLTKSVHLTIALKGNTIAGNITQRTSVRGSNTPEAVLNGSVAGHKTDSTAEFQARFPGLVPNVSVLLKLTSPSSYTMQASTLGGTLMDVSFKRTARP